MVGRLYGWHTCQDAEAQERLSAGKLFACGIMENRVPKRHKVSALRFSVQTVDL